MASLFISYSRRDIESARKLTAAFEGQGLDFWIDWEGIPPTVDWWKEIEKGIEEADIFLFLLSPDSAKSPVCRREIEYAAKNGKRLIPVVVLDIKAEESPTELRSLNWIFIREHDDYDAEFHKLITAIKTDYEWVQTQCQLQVKALEWERNNKENSFLMRGRELREAEIQLTANTSKEPYPTALQREHAIKSRQAAEKQKRRVTSISILATLIIAALAYGPMRDLLDDVERSDWKTLQVDPSIALGENMVLALNPWNANEVYVASRSGGSVSSTQDGGLHWNTTTILRDDGIYGLATARNIVYAITRRAVFLSENGGENWKRTASTPLLGTDHFLSIAINPQRTNNAFIGTSSGQIMETRDAGSTWEPLAKNYEGNTVVALVTNGKVLITATENGIWVYRLNEGRWKELSLSGCIEQDDAQAQITSLAMPLATDVEQIGYWATVSGLGVCDSDYENVFRTSLMTDLPDTAIYVAIISGDVIQNRTVYLITEKGLLRQITLHWTEPDWWLSKFGSHRQ